MRREIKGKKLFKHWMRHFHLYIKLISLRVVSEGGSDENISVFIDSYLLSSDGGMRTETEWVSERFV